MMTLTAPPCRENTSEPPRGGAYPPEGRSPRGERAGTSPPAAERHEQRDEPQRDGRELGPAPLRALVSDRAIPAAAVAAHVSAAAVAAHVPAAAAVAAVAAAAAV